MFSRTVKPAARPARIPDEGLSPSSRDDLETHLSIIVPVFNEEENIEVLHEKISDCMSSAEYDWELLVVDDGSTDATYERLAGIRARDSHLRVVRLRRNFGKSAAYSAGFDHARGGIVVTMDGDLQDDPAEIPLLLSEIAKGHDLVVGWKHEGKGPIGKSLPSRLFNIAVRFSTGITLHDFNCPFKAYRREVLDEIDIHGSLYRYIPVLAHAQGFKLTEVPISNHPRIHGRSKYGASRYMRGMLDLLTVTFITRFAHRPLHLWGGSGIAVGMIGFFILLFFAGAHVLHGAGWLPDNTWNIHDRPALSLGILLMLIGTQFFSIGLLGELFISSGGRRRRDPEYRIRTILED